MTLYQELMIAVTHYYGVGTDQWLEIQKYGIAAPHLEEILSNIPDVSIVKNLDGSIRSLNFAATENITPIAETAVNSNVPAVMQTFDVPATTGLQEVTNAAGETVEQVTFKSGMVQAGNFVFGEVVPMVAAVSAGITVGKTFDKLLYNFDPDFWDEHGMETLDPDKWGEIIGTDTMGGRFINMILRTTPDNKTQAYIDQNALAYMALYMKNKGVFDVENTFTNANLEEFTIDTYKCKFVNNFTLEPVALNYKYNGNASGRYFYLSEKQDNVYIASTHNMSRPTYDNLYFVSKKPFKVIYHEGDRDVIQTPTYENSWLGIVYSFSGQTLHSNNNVKYIYTYQHILDVTTNGHTYPFYTELTSQLNSNSDYMPYAALLYGNGVDKTLGGVDGIGTQDNAKTPDLSNADTVEDVLNALKSQYPQLFENAVTQNVVQPDGTIKTYTYVPAAMPELDPEGNPISSPSTQANPQVDPANATESLLKLITTLIQKDPPVNPPDTGRGNAPIVVIPTGSASALYSIYNPSQAQLNSFGAWLWSSNFVDQLLKLFNDPMQAIIGLHKVFASPSISGVGSIKVGYLDSGVSSNIVGNQYTTVDCGSVSLAEYFGNVFDYEPYTNVYLYLPFIGIVPLSVGEVMRSTIHVVYHVDVLTGACLAEVKITRDAAGGTLFQYSGNAAVQYPISSGSYMGIISGIMSIAGGVAGTIATGGAAMPVLLGAGASVGRMHTDVSHSGSFSGNAGAMGIKKPYLIIDRPQTALAENFPNYIGYPSNTTVKLSSCHGFTKVKEIHLENVPATNNELSDIEMKLKGGVII